MKAWMATAAALALLAGLSTANAEYAAGSAKKSAQTMEQSAPKVKASTHKKQIHQSMRMKQRAPRETTGFGGRAGRIGGGVNDPSIHQSRGDRDSRDFPKQH